MVTNSYWHYSLSVSNILKHFKLKVQELSWNTFFKFENWKICNASLRKWFANFYGSKGKNWSEKLFFFGLVKGLTWFENLYCTGIVYVCRWQELVDSILLLRINTDLKFSVFLSLHVCRRALLLLLFFEGFLFLRIESRENIIYKNPAENITCLTVV